MPSQRSPRVPAVLDILRESTRDQSLELWFHYTREDTTITGHLYYLIPEEEVEFVVSDSFSLDADRLDAVSPFREYRSQHILLDVCRDDEVAGLFEATTIPLILPTDADV